jgi:hypothetical protein
VGGLGESWSRQELCCEFEALEGLVEANPVRSYRAVDRIVAPE